MAVKPNDIHYIYGEALAPFVDDMVKRLDANEHKGGWGDCELSYLLQRLLEEAGELVAACMLDSDGSSQQLTDRARQVCKEAADVANFAMMVSRNANEPIRDP